MAAPKMKSAKAKRPGNPFSKKPPMGPPPMGGPPPVGAGAPFPGAAPMFKKGGKVGKK
jgi:hypothetical protein